ncbi:Predicted protein [Taphrina deformans PYCC 5710]|uniref:Cupin type-2 domain-containing protein n=1 Tax=Taphrina deformans (strain PYCC 5710 / ATCC 11124 / CBS 356.35 / IMI 108563 / JCM 9778 / NBRC 8474) TaxID=1097556 RepID=R4XCX3_TAPDE|nr:Predicted protein [Taphrina deformans PYCC 5710]|eukprot:CCG83654.1 Predicted protein [Taphrina deformans PYCC 5710]
MSDPAFASTVVVTKKQDVGKKDTGQSQGMKRMAAITGLAQGICASVMTAEPHSKSAVHTHGDQDTIVYASKGVGKISFEGGRRVVEVREGDFALIPRHCEHQEINDSDGVIEWIITRSGTDPVVENLDVWETSVKS